MPHSPGWYYPPEVSYSRGNRKVPSRCFCSIAYIKGYIQCSKASNEEINERTVCCESIGRQIYQLLMGRSWTKRNCWCKTHPLELRSREKLTSSSNFDTRTLFPMLNYLRFYETLFSLFDLLTGRWICLHRFRVGRRRRAVRLHSPKWPSTNCELSSISHRTRCLIRRRLSYLDKCC